jgi:hypothetical protein
LDTLQRSAIPLVADIIEFVHTLDDLIAFIFTGVQEHADVLLALEDLAAEVRLSACVRRRIIERERVV